MFKTKPFLCFLLGLTAFGCNPSGRGGVSVSGTVQVQGRPLAKGSIVFSPKSNGIGHRAAGLIENGKFELLNDLGPKPGEYVVQIFDESSQEQALDDPLEYSKLPAERGIANAVPAQFNTNSKLVRTIDEHAENRFDFDLRW